MKISEILKESREENFKRWFGDSKVVDNSGKPLKVYHGTHADFSEFRPNPSLGGGVFFSPDPSEASVFAYAKGANVIPVYLSAQNPYPKIVRSYDEVKTFEKAKKAGYDSVRVRDSSNGVINWVVFSPSQIKSATGNIGDFDLSSPDITKESMNDKQ